MESPVLRRGRPRGEFYICPLVLTRALFERMCISERIGKYDHCLIILRLSGSVKLAVVSHPSRGLWSYSVWVDSRLASYVSWWACFCQWTLFSPAHVFLTLSRMLCAITECNSWGRPPARLPLPPASSSLALPPTLNIKASPLIHHWLSPVWAWRWGCWDPAALS